MPALALLRRHAFALAWAVASGVGAVVTRRFLFPAGSPNLDELGYLSQAEAIRAGRLTLPAATHDPYFLPYLSGVRGSSIVFKYQPGWPALMALSQAVFGSYLVVLAASASTFALAAYWFTLELTRRRSTAIVATVLTVASPFVVVQSATYLAYLPSAALVTLAGAATLRGLRTSGSLWLVGAGVLLGLTFFHRSFDAVLWGIPLLGLVVLRSRTQGAVAVGRRLASVAVGAVPGLTLFLLYNHRVMGSPLRPAFDASGPIDVFGFGRRASFVIPGRGGGIDFTPAMSSDAIWQYLQSLGDFALGGWLLTALALTGAVLAWRRGGALAVVLVASVVGGYFFWWGVANSVKYGLDHLLGPFYWLPAFVPFAALAALGCSELAARAAAVGSGRGVSARFVLASILGLLVLLSAVGIGDLEGRVREASDARAQEVVLQRMAGPASSITFLAPEFPGDPYTRAVVPPNPQSVFHLIALGPEQGDGLLGLVDRYPGRELFQISPQRDLEGIFEPASRSRQRLELVRGTSFEIRLAVDVPLDWNQAVTYARIGREEQTDPAGPVRAGDHLQSSFAITDVPGSGTAYLHAGVRLSNGRQRSDGYAAYECIWELRGEGTGPVRRLVALDPPRTRHLYVFENRSLWSNESLDPLLDCDLVAARS